MAATAINYEKYPTIKIFETHGVEFAGLRGEEFYGSCPFTGKADKFYVNRKTWLWDSKTASMSGNVPKFLEEIQEQYLSNFEDEQRRILARHRKLPLSAFDAWHVGWTGSRYAIPVRDIDGKLADIRLYDVKRKFMRSTSGCHVGLLGAHQMKTNLTDPVYICEGEWDAMAMQWLLKKTNTQGICVAVPGAGIFKREWLKWFSGRRVHAMYDHDEPGRKGEQKVYESIGSIAKSITFCHWPDELPDGFDVRDWIVYGIKKDTLDLCLQRLLKLFKKKPRRNGTSQRAAGGQVIRLVGKADTESTARPDHIPTLEDVYAVYRKWLFLPNTDAIDVMLATALSQHMDGPPVWMFFVGPPGGAKTITLSGLADYEKSYATSSLTPHALISGANWQGQADPSLIPRLDGKVLVIKDFTSILNLRENEKEEIFGILRDAYDGKCGKIFGNGVERMYTSHFTIVAAVTPSIYDVGARHSALGERFLKYVMGDNLHHQHEDDIIRMAIENVDQDTTMREELTRVTSQFLTYGFETVEPPKLDSIMHHQIIRLSQFGARLRGTVSRDLFNQEMMTGKPFAEVGSRLGIQLSKLARAMATIRGKDAVTDAEYQIVRKVMLDTISQKCEDVVRCLWEHRDEDISVEDLSNHTRYSSTTVRRMLDDLNLLKVVERKGSGGSGFKHRWTLTTYMRGTIIDSKVYDGPTPKRLLIKRAKRSAAAR